MDHPVLLCDHYPHRNRPGWQHWLRRWWNIIDPIARVGGRRRRQVLPRGLWRSLVSVLVERRTLEGGRVVQMDLTTEIKVVYMLFERCHSKDILISIKQHIKYFNFRVK